jgi:glycosyltransferase involved in cell wall biosynthesis
MDRPLRVLHVIPSVGPLRGGPSVMVRTMARGLAHAGLEVHVAATDDNGHGRLDVPHAIPVVEDRVAYHFFPRQTRFYGVSWPLSRWLARHVRDYDLVHVHALFSFAAVPAAYWAALAGVPYVVRPLGTLNRWGMEHRRPWLKRLSFATIERRILRGAARIHYTSEQEQIEVVDLGVNRCQAMVPLGIDLTPFAELPPRGWLRERVPGSAGRPVALFLSRLDAKKGLDLLLAGFARARSRRPDLVLVIAGSGEPGFEQGVRRDATRLGLGDNVYWAGFLSDKEKLAALADADIFVLPSYSENFGVAVVEAMAAGLPVVISDRVGIHREVAAARAGLVVPCEPEAVAEAVLQLTLDAGLRDALGTRGRELARSRFSLEAMTDGLIEMYSEVLGASHRADEKVAWPPSARSTRWGQR